MRESKTLKIICYILIPVFVLILGISLFYEACKEEYLDSTWDDKMFFQSDDFLYSYMNVLSEETSNLIYNNSQYKNLNDENYIIYYNESSINYGLNVEDFYYLIIYRNKAFTNVELTANTNTIKKIKEYIEKANIENGKKANLINGEVFSNSEIISNKAIKYFNLFENTYYTTEKYLESESIYNIQEFEEGSTKIYNIYTETIKDIEIYSSYKEQVSETEYSLFYKEIIMFLNRYENIFVIAIPVMSILLVLIAIYLIMAIGYSKDGKRIEENDIDKIPIEIVTGVVAGIVSLLIFSAMKLSYRINPENIIGFISLYLALYFIGYILCATWGITLVKRIKMKTFFKTSIIVNIFKVIIKIIQKVIDTIVNLIKKAYRKLAGNISMYLKVIGTIYGYLLLSVLLVMFFNIIGFVISIVLAFVLLYPIAVDVSSYKKIENKLEKVRSGDYNEKLDKEDFSSAFYHSVDCINEISSGFEKAIEESVKSERLKTELITNVSHDIKTPLTSIINYVDLIKKENIENEKVKEYLEILDNKSQRLKKLTQDLVEASKASSGNVKLNLEKINICELIKQSTGEFEDKFKAHNLEINFDFPETDAYIQADNRYMYRVIENLYSNISKYALENSRVYVDIKKEDDKVNIAIKNISKDKLNISADELMQRFVRGDKSRSTEGSGLGISISKSLTELQKGIFNLQIDGDLFKVELIFHTI